MLDDPEKRIYVILELIGMLTYRSHLSRYLVTHAGWDCQECGGVVNGNCLAMLLQLY